MCRDVWIKKIFTNGLLLGKENVSGLAISKEGHADGLLWHKRAITVNIAFNWQLLKQNSPYLLNEPPSCSSMQIIPCKISQVLEALLYAYINFKNYFEWVFIKDTPNTKKKKTRPHILKKISIKLGAAILKLIWHRCVVPLLMRSSPSVAE